MVSRFCWPWLFAVAGCAVVTGGWYRMLAGGDAYVVPLVVTGLRVLQRLVATSV